MEYLVKPSSYIYLPSTTYFMKKKIGTLQRKKVHVQFLFITYFNWIINSFTIQNASVFCEVTELHTFNNVPIILSPNVVWCINIKPYVYIQLVHLQKNGKGECNYVKTLSQLKIQVINQNIV
jgi:hypothetical protein